MNNNQQKTDGENSAKRSPYKEGEYEQFVEFYVLPASERKKLGYKNMSEWCTKNNIHRNTISRWKSRDDFKKQIYSRRMEWGNDQISEVFEGWKKSCVKGNAASIELFIAFFLGWDKKQIINNQPESFRMDDIRTLLAPLPQERQNEFYILISNIIGEANVHIQNNESRKKNS